MSSFGFFLLDPHMVTHCGTSFADFRGPVDLIRGILLTATIPEAVYSPFHARAPIGMEPVFARTAIRPMTTGFPL